jgi:hypothetical protein
MRSIVAMMAFGTMLLLCIVPFGTEGKGAPVPIDADVGDNDWPEQASRIGTGTYRGEVSDYYEGEYPNGSYVTDNDCYSIAVPPYLSLKVRIDSVKGFDPYLSCDSYYSDESDRTDIDIYSNDHNLGTGYWYNVRNEVQEQVLWLRGNCTYQFTVWFDKVPLEYQKDQQFNWVDEEPVTNGTFTGSVDAKEITKPSAEYYIMTVLNGSAGKVTLSKVGSEMDFLKMEVYERYDFSGDHGLHDYFEDGVDVFLTDENRSLVYDPYEEAAEEAGYSSSPFSSWYDDDDGLDPGFYPGDVDIYIRVWGTGNYTITFEQVESEYRREMIEDQEDEEDEDDDEGSSADGLDMVLTSLFCTIMLPFVLLLWIVVILVIVNLVKRKRRQEKDLPPSQRKALDGPPEKADKGDASGKS